MLKKRIFCLTLAILSFFVLSFNVSAFDLGSWFGKKAEEPVQTKSFKLYMPTQKVEPQGGASKRLSYSSGAKQTANALYDGDTSKTASYEKDATVTLDMGVNILLSGIRYFANKSENKSVDNCLGTRFYASTDNRRYTELAVIEEAELPENEWREILFSGFGEYRYFRVELPQNANISEIEWLGASGFSAAKRRDGLYDIKISLCGFDAPEDFDATVIAAVYNGDGVMKHADMIKQSFKAEVANNFEAVISGVPHSSGDSYRIALFDNEGVSPIPNPLNYCVNGASSELSIASVFADNMVIQAEKPVTVWGKGPKNKDIIVKLENDLGGGISRTVRADNNSVWEAELGTFSAGGSYTLTVESGGRSLKCKDITFGDVWLCTGQSNMEYYMMMGEEKEELTNPDAVKNDDIRILNLFNKGINGAAKPVDNSPVRDSWHKMDKDVAAYSTAVGYYFAREINSTTHEPVGIISVAVGDTEINRWLPKGEKFGSFTSTDGDLYNNRIYPFEKLAIKGVILYQGEADQYRTHLSAKEYSDAMAGLVDHYRKSWGNDLPFYWAQLTRYRVDESIVREGQRIALSKVSEKKNTGMITLIDIVGNYKGGTGSCREDIHPWGKKIVAERFAALAKRDCYGGSDYATGPMYKSAERDGRNLVLTFECTGDLQVLPKQSYADKVTDEKIKKEKLDVTKPMEFEIAGADKKYYPADARLEGDKVILSNSEVESPAYARYAWEAYPEMPNLTDETGLPAPTFTTEDLS